MKKKLLVFSVVAVCLLIIAALVVSTILFAEIPPETDEKGEASLIEVSGARIILAIPALQELCENIPLLELGNIVTQTTVSLLIVTVLLVILAYCATRKLTKRPGKAQVVFEKLTTMLYNLVRDTMALSVLDFVYPHRYDADITLGNQGSLGHARLGARHDGYGVV